MVKQVASRYASLLWLLAALSLVGWLIVNLDTAGWIIISLVVGLMAWQLTRRERRERAPEDRELEAEVATSARLRARRQVARDVPPLGAEARMEPVVGGKDEIAGGERPLVAHGVGPGERLQERESRLEPGVRLTDARGE